MRVWWQISLILNFLVQDTVVHHAESELPGSGYGSNLRPRAVSTNAQLKKKSMLKKSPVVSHLTGAQVHGILKETCSLKARVGICWTLLADFTSNHGRTFHRWLRFALGEHLIWASFCSENLAKRRILFQDSVAQSQQITSSRENATTFLKVVHQPRVMLASKKWCKCSPHS